MEKLNISAALAENSLAGCVLVATAETLTDVRGIVSEADFQNEQARAIFAAASRLNAAGQASDPVLIQSEAAKCGQEISSDYIAELMRLFTTTANAADTARVVHEEAQKRRGREIGMLLTQDGITPVQAIARMQDILRSDGGSVREPMEVAQTVMDYIDAVATGKANTYLPTGFDALDRMLSGSEKGGLVNSGLITVAARPGTGKSTIALAIGDSVARRGQKVLYISLEMTEIQLWCCRAAARSGLSRSKIYDGMRGAKDQEWTRLTDTFQEMSKDPFYIRAVPSTVEDVEREARCIDGLALLIVDHIGLIRPMEQGSRYDKMTDTAHRLKQLALSLKIPILALCQLNRQSESRGDKKPTMADLRDSGAIEEDSDVVALLFRPAVYANEEDKPRPWESQELQVIVDKNRHGGTGTVYMRFCGLNARIMEGNNARDDRLPD